ncbi:MAG: TrbI/VirB10 family protein [Proteobacteria bacterium]|nr:TrbI/VirB10 family protein [Burkholderiales bacterium]
MTGAAQAATTDPGLGQLLARWRASSATGEPSGSTTVHADRRWLEQAQTSSATRAAAALTARPAPGAHVVLQGTVVPAVLLTEINSDLPGPLTAQVTQDVWDSIDSRYLLIPRGARLIGEYNADVRPGQERVLAAFSRLILPGGASVDLLGMQAADAQGRSGLNDRVDRHFWQMFGSSFMIAGLASLLQRNETPGTVVVVPGAGAGTGAGLSSAAGTVLVETARSVLGRTRNLPPTLIIRQGHRFVLTVQRDFLVIPSDAGRMREESR